MENVNDNNFVYRITTWRIWFVVVCFFVWQGLICNAINLTDFNSFFPQNSTQVAVQQQDESSLTLTYTIGGFHLNAVAIQGDKWYQLTLDGEPQRLEQGCPDLPVIARSIHIPDSGRLSVRVIDYDYKDLPLTPAAPSKGPLPRTVNPAEVPFEFGACYQQENWPKRI